MNFTADRQALLDCLTTASGAMPTKNSPQEILKNIHIRIEGSTLTAFCTTTEIAIIATMANIDASSSAVALFPPRVITILRESSREHVSFILDGDKLMIDAGTKYTLPMAEVSEFPVVDHPEFTGGVFVPAAALKDAISKCLFAAEESTGGRWACNGVHVEVAGSVASVVATDSRRLSAVTIQLNGEHDEHEANIPRPAATLLQRMLDLDGEAVVYFDGPRLWFRLGDDVLMTRQLEGRYPKWRMLMDQYKPKHFPQVNAGAALTAIRQAQIVANEESRGGRFEFSDNNLTIDCETASIGKSKAQLPITFDGDLSLTLALEYAAQFFKSCSPDELVNVGIVDANTAVLFEAGDNYKHIIMPLAQ